MKRIGAVSGKFRILHNAHKEYIVKATLEVDILHVFIVDDKTIKRHATIKETQAAIGKILQELDVKYYIHIAPYTTDMLEWDNYVINTIGHKDVIMYNSKEEYTNVKLKTGYINCEHALSISASEIEKNPFADHNFRNIASEFMPYLNKKVVISGVESCGKTQMATKMAMLNSTVYSREVGRYYAEECLGGEDDAFEAQDFVEIAMRQLVQDKQMNNNAKRFLVVDTDPIVTLRFLDAYYLEYKERNILSESFEENYQLCREKLYKICLDYNTDLTIILAPNVRFVADGLRWQQEQTVRQKNHETLLNLYAELGKEVVVIDADNYKERFKQASDEITKVLKR